MKKRIQSENGVVIVEATIVFPVMFLVIFLMLVAGNAYLQKCKVEAFANRLALSGAAYCADPLLKSAEKESFPDSSELHIKPYRYFFGGMKDIKAEIESDAYKGMDKVHTGLFSGMKPQHPVIEVEFNNQYIYSTFQVEFDYDITMPFRLLFAKDYIKMHFSTQADVPVSDSMEFIRNVDMVDDYLESSGGKEKIQEVINKAKEWFDRG